MKKVKFTTQVDPELLVALRTMAGTEGRQLQTMVDEALRGYIERKQGLTPGNPVLQAMQASMAQYDSLYRELSK